jgi:hypothetical protein
MRKKFKDLYRIRIPENVDVSKGLTAAQLRNLIDKKIATFVPIEKPGIDKIKDALTGAGIKFQSEKKFCKDRRFKFDIAFPKKKIAIEYEGIFSNKSRHTTMGGYAKDCEKYNLAAQLGWKVFRYTSKSLKGNGITLIIESLKKFLK